MSYRALRYEVRDQIAIITLDRPETRNALDLAMREELTAAVLAVRKDDAVRAVVLTGAGGAFCAGGDLRALSEERRPVDKNRGRIRDTHVWYSELRNVEKPVIAAVDGPAFGGGFNLALAADFVLATPRARFCQVFARVGLVPDLFGLYLLPRIVGLQKAKELIFTGRVMDAAEANALGIVYSLHEPDALMDAAMDLARRFCQASTLALGLAKNILNQSFEVDQHALAELEAYAQALCIDSEYHRNAVARFLRKEPLAFDWEKLSRNKEAAR